MMFYPKMLKTKKVSNYKVSFSAFKDGMNSDIDDGILPYKYAKSCYNYSIESGALKNGIGFEPLTLPVQRKSAEEQQLITEIDVKIKGLWVYKYFNSTTNLPDYKLLYYADNGKIYWANLTSQYPYSYEIASFIYSNGIPNALNYRLNGSDYMIFSSPTDGMWKYSALTQAERIQNGPSIVSMCMHYERLFAIVENGERNRLSFSDDFDPTNWNESLSEGGFIEMQDERGPLNCVVSFNDYIYVFRDFGVARVSAYGDQTEFSVSQLFVSSAKIYGKSVCVCGDRIMFLNRDGIVSFDGYTANTIDFGIDNLFKGVSNDNCSALYYNGKYYLACRLNFDDDEQIGCESYTNGYINNALIEVDLKTGDISISRGIDICSMLLVDNGDFCKVIACFNGEYADKIGQMTHDGKMFNTVLKKCWVSPKSNLGYPTQQKRVKEVLIKSKSNCKVKISTENQSKTYNVCASSKSQRLKTNVFGDQVQISFICDEAGDVEISCPQIIIGVTS